MADELLHELAPLLAEEGIDLDGGNARTALQADSTGRPPAGYLYRWFRSVNGCG